MLKGKTQRCAREALKGRAVEMLLNRRRRERFLNRAMLGDLAWDLLLALYVFDGSRAKFTIGRLSDYLGMPKSTAIRWLDYLCKESLAERQDHPTDRRTATVEISATGRSILDKYFREILDGNELR